MPNFFIFTNSDGFSAFDESQLGEGDLPDDSKVENDHEDGGDNLGDGRNDYGGGDPGERVHHVDHLLGHVAALAAQLDGVVTHTLKPGEVGSVCGHRHRHTPVHYLVLEEARHLRPSVHPTN